MELDRMVDELAIDRIKWTVNEILIVAIVGTIIGIIGGVLKLTYVCYPVSACFLLITLDVMDIYRTIKWIK